LEWFPGTSLSVACIEDDDDEEDTTKEQQQQRLLLLLLLNRPDGGYDCVVAIISVGVFVSYKK